MTKIKISSILNILNILSTPFTIISIPFLLFAVNTFLTNTVIISDKIYLLSEGGALFIIILSPIIAVLPPYFYS